MTQTATLRLTEPTDGGDTDTWGGLINADLVYIDEAINQAVTVNIPDANVVLTADGSSGDQARYATYLFTGALTANRTVTLPSCEKLGWVRNATTGGHNVILSAGSTTYSVPPVPTGTFWRFRVDTSNVVSSPVVGFGQLTAAGFVTLGGTDASPIADTTSGWIFSTLGQAQGYSATGVPLQISTGAPGTPSQQALLDFYYGTTLTGNVATDGTSTFFNTTSDYRLKTLHGAADGSFVSYLKVHDASFTKAPEKRYPMLLAHELAEFAPWAVVGEKDATDEHGSIKPQHVDHSRLVPALIAAIQLLEARIEALEAGAVS